MTPKTKSVRKTPAGAPVLYLYAISRAPGSAAPAISTEAIDGAAPVEALRSGKYLCWLSRVSKQEFADQLTEHMQNLEWLATAGLRHQRVVADIASLLTVLPARFGTVFLDEESLAQHLKERSNIISQALARVTDADEWGIKIFAERKAYAGSTVKAASGTDYLKKKSDILQPSRSAKLDSEVQGFVASLNKMAVAASPGGRASAGQPGLVWHGSFLIRRKDRKKLETTLRKYAAAWADSRRIDCSGPWPPYSFVEDHAH